MIKINLLPETLRRKESTTKIPVLPILFIAIFIVLSLNILFVLLVLYKRTQVSHIEQKWNNMQGQFKEVSDLKKELVTKKEKLKVMEYTLKRDVYWTDFLNKINQSVPKGLWLNRLTLSSKQGLVIEGSVFSFSADQVSLVNRFFNELKSDQFFQQNFNNFSLGSVQRRTVKQYEILDFLLTASINQERFGVEYKTKK